LLQNSANSKDKCPRLKNKKNTPKINCQKICTLYILFTIKLSTQLSVLWWIVYVTKAMGPVHAPLFPEPKFEEWWIFLADGPSAQVQQGGCNPQKL
jgi:hypothetical protein